MAKVDHFVHPTITPDDIRWASALLGSPEPDFFGDKGDDPRQKVIMSTDTLDIAACPGSGKTTLLVAKLAILAKKWPYQTRGICVLSHTNAARLEIELRLGNTSVGRSLLTYPHFVGTIHSFVNEFLALPWLRSLDYTVKTIDNDAVERYRRYLINTDRQYSALRYAIAQKEKYQNWVGQWFVSSSDFHVLKTDGNPVFKNVGPAADQLKKLVKIVMRDGYFRHDEMFVWANDLLTKLPERTWIIRQRFPLLYIDETQDNNESQSTILQRIFGETGNPNIRQRFGDVNQAIFNFAGDTGAISDAFPDETIQINLPNSHRFGQTIADLSTPLGMINYDMRGQGPKISLESGDIEGRHTVFVFEEVNINKVLDAYANLLINTFSNRELLTGIFSAVGLVHKDTGDNNIPRHVGHYWTRYDSQINRQNPKPETLVQYIFQGQELAGIGDDIYPTVEKIAEGILVLARMSNSELLSPRRTYLNRYIIGLLDECPDVLKIYEEALFVLAVKKYKPSKQEWEDIWLDKFRRIGDSVSGVSLSGSDVDKFLSWSNDLVDEVEISVNNKNHNNIYRFSKNGKEVSIQVGSIHSIKGETHTATLVMETFWHEHHIEAIFPWLDGRNMGPGRTGKRQKTRLKTQYVAITRPTHLLCLAIKHSTLENENGGLEQSAKKLKKQGWYDVVLVE